MTDENENPIVTNVDSETHEATVESKSAEDVVSVEVVRPDVYKHPFVGSVRSLLDHMRSEPKHAALATLLDDCERQYKNLFRENNHGEVPAESD